MASGGDSTPDPDEAGREARWLKIGAGGAAALEQLEPFGAGMEVAVGASEKSTDLQVRIGCRTLSFPMESQVSYARLTRDLAAKLRVSGSASLQLSDAAGRRIRTEDEFQDALSGVRTPLQASLTAFALRDVETHKANAEAEKEELSHCQWQIIADKFSSFATEIAAVAADFQAVKDECHSSINRCHAQEAMHRDRMTAVIDREAAARAAAQTEMERRLDAMAASVTAERSARDVAVFQLKSQMQGLTQGLEDDRALRAQERAETARALQAMEHTLEGELQRGAAHREEASQGAKHLDSRLDACEAHGGMTDFEMTRLGGECDRLRASVAQLELSLAQHKRIFEESLQRRGDELSRAVRDEVAGRENHLAGFARNLEASFEGVEAKIARAREDAAGGLDSMTERTRVLERRCEQLERELSEHRAMANEKALVMSEKLERAWNLVDKVDMSVAASDAILQPTANKVDDLLERLTAAECELQLRPRQDVVTTQFEALHRSSQKHEAGLANLEKSMNSRFASEAMQRDTMKAQLRSSVQSCLDKIVGMYGSKRGESRQGGKALEGKLEATLPAKALYGAGESPGDAPQERPTPLPVRPQRAQSGTGISRPTSPMSEGGRDTMRQSSSPLFSPESTAATWRQLPLSARGSSSPQRRLVVVRRQPGDPPNAFSGSFSAPCRTGDGGLR